MAIKDFQASQVRSGKIIGSGSGTAGGPGLIVYSASDASDYQGGLTDSGMLTNVGTDVFLFVSGSKTDASGMSSVPSGPRQNVTLFGGDVVISGTMFAEHSVVEVDGNITGSLMVSGSLVVSRSAAIKDDLWVTDNFYVSGTATLGSSLSVGNDLWVADNAYVSGTLDAAGVISAAGGLSGSYVETGLVKTTVGSLTLDSVSDITLDAAGEDINFKESGTTYFKWNFGGSTTPELDVVGDFIVDASGDITLDAAGGNWYLADSGVGVGEFANVGSDLVISSSKPNFDIVFKGQAAGASSTEIARVDTSTSVFSGSALETGLIKTTAGDLTVDSVGDIALSADGDQITMDDGTTTRFTFNVDSTPELDVAGDFVIDASGDITIDAGGGNVTFKSAGSQFLDLVPGEFSSGDAVFKDTGGTEIFRIDASEDSLLMASTNQIQFTDANEAIWGDSTNLHLKATSAITIMSGGAGTDPDPVDGTDVSFFVSGAISSKDTSVRGAALFGGDLVVSGSTTAAGSTTIGNDLWVADNAYVSGSATVAGVLSAAGSFTVGNDLWVTDNAYVSGSATIDNGLVVNESGDSGTANDFRVESDNSTHMLFVDSTDNKVGIRTSAPKADLDVGDLVSRATIKITAGGGSSGSLEFVQSGGGHAALALVPDGSFVLVNSASNKDIIFKVNDGGTLKEAVIIDASEPRMLILSGGAGSSPDESTYVDINFFVSGAAGSKDSSVTGTALFGGDLHVSGNLSVDGTGLGTGGGNIGWATGSAGFLVGGGEGPAGWISTTGSLALSGTNLDVGQYIRHIGDTTTKIEFAEDRIRLYADDGAGTARQMLQLEGTPSSAGQPQIMFNGDARYFDFGVIGREGGKINIHLSGTYGSSQYPSAGTKDTNLFLSGTQVLILSGGAGASPDPVAGTDVAFFVSGAIGSKDGSIKATSLFGGDVAISGSAVIYATASVYTIVGGQGSTIRGDTTYGFIGGGHTNEILGANYTTIAGGASNFIEGDGDVYGVIGGGRDNVILASGSTWMTIGGGRANTLKGDCDGATISGGFMNTITGSQSGEGGSGYSLIAGGHGTDIVDGYFAAVCGGYNHAINAGSSYSFIGGGYENSITALYGAVLAGTGSTVTGQGSFAIGTGLTVPVANTIAIGGGTGHVYTTVVSGTLLVTDTVSGSIHRTAGGLSYLVAGSNVSVVSSSNGQILISSTGGGGASTVGWTGPSAGVITTTGSLGVGVSVPTHALSVVGAVSASLGLSGSLTRLVDGRSYLTAGANVTVTSSSNGQIVITSTAAGTVDGAGGATRLAYWADADTLMSNPGFHFNEYTLGLTGSATGATSAQDVHRIYAGTAGNTTLGGHAGASGILIDYDVTGIVASGQYQNHRGLWVKYDQSAPSHVGLVQGVGLYVEMTGSTSGTQTVDGISVNVNDIGSLASDAARGILINAPPGWVNGTANGSHLRCYNQADTGDYFDISVGAAGKTQLTTVDSGGASAHLNLKPDGIVTILSGGAAASPNETSATDIVLFVSGAIGSRDSAVNGTALFGGDTVISGSLLVGGRNFHAQAGAYVGGTISGSIHQTSGGISYLAAGSNVTITSASNGQVTIASTAGGTVDGSGAATRLAYWSDADTLTSDTDLIFDGDTLTAANSSNTAIPAIKIDRNYTGTTTVGNYTTDPQGLLIDYDVTGIVATGQTQVHDALAINYNQDSPTMVGTIEATGADIRMTGGTSGAQSMKGVAITLAGADTHIGIDVTAPNDSTHLIARSSDSILDYFKISVGESGATTVSTNDQGAAVGNLTLDADGKIIIEAVAGDEAVFNEGGLDVDFRVESSTKQGALLLDGGTVQVGLLTDGTSAADAYGLNASTDPIPVDTSLFVSGAIGSRGGAVKGTSLFGGDVVVSGSLCVGSGSVPSSAKTAFSVVNDFSDVTFESQLSDHDCGGNIIKYGGGGMVSSGRLCYLSGSGNWQPTDAGRALSGSYNMLAVAMGSTPSRDGMLLEGFYKLPSNKLRDNPASDDIGKPVYMASGSSGGSGMGKFTLTAPSGSSEVVRVVGHCVDIDSDDILLYFKPDSTSIILS
jgi:hypothetical protein